MPSRRRLHSDDSDSQDELVENRFKRRTTQGSRSKTKKFTPSIMSDDDTSCPESISELASKSNCNKPINTTLNESPSITETPTIPKLSRRRQGTNPQKQVKVTRLKYKGSFKRRQRKTYSSTSSFTSTEDEKEEEEEEEEETENIKLKSNSKLKILSGDSDDIRESKFNKTKMSNDSKRFDNHLNEKENDEDDDQSSDKDNFELDKENSSRKNERISISATSIKKKIKTLKEKSTFIFSTQFDTNSHHKDCYVCGKIIDDSNKVCCFGCLLSYHENCVIKKETEEDDHWLCPKCSSQFIPRKVEFFRDGKPTSHEYKRSEVQDSIYYKKNIVGLTRHLTGCGLCGGQSSQRRMAVICDNCDREFHLKCLDICTDELPTGNWLCPDCVEFDICMSCVMKTRSNQEKNMSDGDDDDEEENYAENKTIFHHPEYLLKCEVCNLKYHFSCLKNAVGLHRKYTCEELLKFYEKEYQNKNNENSQVSFKSYLKSLDYSSQSEFWLCDQCQDHLTIHKIISQRTWKDPGSSESDTQIQLLVKFKSLSYRTLLWLPLPRIRYLYPNGVRKWLQVPELTSTNSNFGDTEDNETDDESLENDEDDKHYKTNSSSIKKIRCLQGDEFILPMKMPSGLKSNWLIPDRVIAKRACPRGSSRFQYLVKWGSLPYEDSTWEFISAVYKTKAMKFFLSLDAIDRVLTIRPTKIIRIPKKDPTLFEFDNENPTEDSLFQFDCTLKQGCNYIVQTASATNTISKEISSNQFEIFNMDDSDKRLELRKQKFASGLFVPYTDRPSFLCGKILYDYQLEGINWLRFAWSKQRSVILADEMGLGKTVQVISFLASLWNDYAVQGPFLIIAPLATLEDVWMREINHWASFMNVVSYFGNPEGRMRCVNMEFFNSTAPQLGFNTWLEKVFSDDVNLEYDRYPIRSRIPKKATKDRCAKFDAIVTSYEIFRKDHFLFKQINWKVIVVDEGHRLKSFTSEVKRALEGCKSDMRLLLTGTPLQNSIDELFSLLNVLHPDKFPESSKEKYQDLSQDSTIEKLKEELQSHILRRTKKDVMGGRMPAKKERLLLVENTPQQKEIYRNIILRNHVALSTNIKFSNNGKKNFRVSSLRNIVMQMRKCCNHPYLFEDYTPQIRTEAEFDDLLQSSGKLILLDRMLTILKPRGHRVLIFSQFMKLLDILEEYLNYKKFGYERLDGSTTALERQRGIDRYNTLINKKFVFLLSTRAGGLGINLTSADTVILYDSDWNPHNDLQAQARAHRLGQTKKVAIYRFMTRASVEERIIEIAKNKLVLDQVVAGKISLRDVEAVVRCGARELFDDRNGKEFNYDDQQLLDLLDRETGDDDLDDKNNAGDEGVVGGVLDAFKIAHYDIPSEPLPANDGSLEDDGEFWKDLLLAKTDQAQQQDEYMLQDDEGLGRGMRARREVTHYKKDKHLEDSVSEEQSSEEDGEDYSGNSKVNEGKNNQKSKKSSRGQSDPLEIFVCSKTVDGKYSVKNIIDRKEDRYTFRIRFQDMLPSIFKPIRTLRKSLGLSETLRTTRPIELPTRLESTGKKDSRVGFGLVWDLNWLSKLLDIQAHPSLVRHPPFIIQHGGRHFLLSKPIALKLEDPITDEQEPLPFSIRINDQIASLREILTEELTKWQVQHATSLHRSMSALTGNLRSDVSRQKQTLAAALSVSGGNLDWDKTGYTQYYNKLRAVIHDDNHKYENIFDIDQDIDYDMFNEINLPHM